MGPAADSEVAGAEPEREVAGVHGRAGGAEADMHAGVVGGDVGMGGRVMSKKGSQLPIVRCGGCGRKYIGGKCPFCGGAG